MNITEKHKLLSSGSVVETRRLSDGNLWYKSLHTNRVKNTYMEQYLFGGFLSRKIFKL